MQRCPLWVLCHEYCRSTRRCATEGGPPFEVGNQVLISSHRKLLSSKATVVSVAETPGQDSGRQERGERKPTYCPLAFTRQSYKLGTSRSCSSHIGGVSPSRPTRQARPCSVPSGCLA